MYLPEQFRGSVLGLRTDIVRGLTGVKPERLVDFENPSSIARSLRHFAEQTTRSGELAEIVSQHLSKTLIQLPTDFKLTSWLQDWRNSYWPKETRFFGFDTEHGLILHAKNSDGQRVAWCLGMSIISPKKSEFYRYRKIDPNQFGKTEIMIEQVQAPLWEIEESTRKASYNFRWEHVLTTLAFRWARQIGIPRLLFQPAENNIYIVNSDRKFPEVESRYQRMRIHYDIVANECGFKRNGPNTVYSISTSNVLIPNMYGIINGKSA